MPEKAALISVSDKTGIVDFARELQILGYTLLTSGGTGKFLTEAGVEVVAIEGYTGQREILGGRVKTLHPKIHAGILARRDHPEDIAEIEKEGIYSIDVVVVNLYPFLEGVTTGVKDRKKMVELIDIGGPAMIRAAAKNFSHVYPVIDPADYQAVVNELKASTSNTDFRTQLMSKVFAQLAEYNAAIAQFFSADEQGVEPQYRGLTFSRAQSLRYGENPHQSASWYLPHGASAPFQQFQGKSLSYNNLLDFDAAARLLRSAPQEEHFAAILKHCNPCGAALGDSLVEALQLAKKSDPRSHFGGIVALNREVDQACAEEISRDFAELVVAPGYSEAAREILAKKKNLRVLQIDVAALADEEWRSAVGGFLVQAVDSQPDSLRDSEQKCGQALEDQERKDLEFAWFLVGHVRSNAIVLVKDNLLLAAGAGQMSRIDAVELALQKAKTHAHDLQGAVAASDAFFPFADNIETLGEAGISAIVVPGGAKRDDEVIAACENQGIKLCFTKNRHFRH